MPLSDRRSDDAWDNLRRQPHMTDVEDAMLGVMAEAQAAGTIPGAPAAPPAETTLTGPPRTNQLDLSALGIEGSETIEGALSDLFTFAEFTDLTLTIDGDNFAVFGLQINKDHVLGLLRVWNAFQASTDDRETEQLGQALWNALTDLIEGMYHALRQERGR